MDKRIYNMRADMCKVFTSPIRIEILDILRNGKKSVNELVKETGLSQSNISQHLQVMREKGFVRTEKKGNYVFYTLANPKISKAFRIMKEILKDKLAETEKLYKTMKKEKVDK